jgi:hypothetical protein
MLKRIAAAATIVAATGGMFMGMTGTASACTDTVGTVVPIDCTTSCPPPTRPRAAVYVDGHWVVVCA